MLSTLTEGEGWINVDLGNSRGWIRKGDIEFSNSPGESNCKEVFSMEPPSFSFNRFPLSTISSEFTLKGVVRDKGGLDIVSVFVGEDKVFLKSNVGSEIPISFRLELKDGINYVTVVAKDEEGLSSRETIVIRRR